MKRRCAREIATKLAYRAYRGYSTPQNVDALMGFYKIGRSNGGSFDDGVTAIVQRVLVDPKFLYRVESTPNGVAPGAAYRVSDLDLASRLSFFLWSSDPGRHAAAARGVEAAVASRRCCRSRFAACSAIRAPRR